MKCTFFHFKIPYFNQNFIFHYIHSIFYVSAVVSSPRPSASQSHVPGSFLSHSGTDLEQKKKLFSPFNLPDIAQTPLILFLMT